MQRNGAGGIGPPAFLYFVCESRPAVPLGGAGVPRGIRDKQIKLRGRTALPAGTAPDFQVVYIYGMDICPLGGLLQ